MDKERGDAAFKVGNYQEAIDAYSAALDSGGSDATLYSNRSAAFAKLGNWVRAKEDAQSCTEMRSNWARGWSRLGAAEEGLRNHSAALEAYKKGLHCEPENQILKDAVARLSASSSSSSSSFPRPSYSSSASSPIFSAQAAPPGAPVKNPLQLIFATVIFLLNVATVVFSVFSMVPTFDSTMQHRFFLNAMMTALVGMVLGVVRTHGYPTFATFKKVWNIVRTKQGGDSTMFSFLTDVRLHYMMYASLFLTSTPSFMAVIPINIISLYCICQYFVDALPAFLPFAVRFVNPIVTKVTGNWTRLDRMNANTEVLLFFVLIFQIFTPARNLLLTVLYAHAFLRIRYMSNTHSKQAWTNVRVNADRFFKNAACPAIITSLYDKLVNFASGLGNPTA